MAAASRYWRIWFRSSVNYSTSNLAFASMMPKDSSNNNLTTGLTITTNATLINGTTYPLTALTDGNATTYCGINYAASNAITWYWIQFTYASPVLIDRLLFNIYQATSLNGTTIITSNLVDVMVDSSEDNVTWIRQAIVYSPVSLGSVDTIIPALTTSEYYPLPSAQEIGGSGGIYGIVSEDGVAQPNRPVILFERSGFNRVGYTTTNEYGGYAFNGLNLDREFAVMSYDPSGPPYKNALIWDRIKPINTKGNLVSQNAFWARRCRDPHLGGIVSFSGYLNGIVYRFLKANVLGTGETIYQNNNKALMSMDFYPDSRVGGSLLFLKSGRHHPTVPVNLGLLMPVCYGSFNGVNQSGNDASYRALTFEYIIKAPQSPEDSLIITWSGTRDSDDSSFQLSYNSYAGHIAGPTLEVTQTTLNVRMALSTANLTTVRATSPVVAGGIYHVMVTYEQDVEIKLYMNGVLTQTTAIVGNGRLFGWSKSTSGAFSVPINTWDANITTVENKLAAIRRFTMCEICGTGTATNTPLGTPGWGGGFGLSALYGRKFTLAEVETYYDSFVNWESHVVPTTQSGYMGQVEADNPMYYWRMNELSNVRGLVSTLGRKDVRMMFEGSPAFSATGFVAGSTSITTSLGGVLSDSMEFPVLQSVFTLEFFMRPSVVSGTYQLFMQRVYNTSTEYPVSVSLIAGVINLLIRDHATLITTIVCPTVFAINTAYHVAITYDPWVSKVCNFVVNGVLVYSVPATAVPDLIGYPQRWFAIGVNPTATVPTIGNRFQGQLGEVAIYNYPLSVERLLAHYNARNT